jgi:hypothetical protein
MLIAGCNDEETPNQPSGLIYSYFPVNVGHEVIYDVTLITFDEFSQAHDTDIYQIREVIESVFDDAQGRPTQRIERYRRNTPNDAWVINDVWTSNMTSVRAEKMEENITYVKMVFPISSSVSWNGNSLNTMEAQDYEYDQINQADVAGGIAFDSTLTVIQIDDENPIETRYEIEKYATGVGCIYKVHNKIEKLPVGIKSQRLYSETIVSWSN